jgi:eukaryotic-like serine/threonine-protein kinase
LIHRDFKPDNVLVGFDGRVRVIDFGLARPARTNLETPSPDSEEVDEVFDMTSSKLHARLTTVGSLFGTPIYMAPEQHQKIELDARADQFAFCASLYEALYGQLPFAAESYIQLADAVIEGKVRIPPDKPDIPRRVVDAILRGLRPAPDARFPSMTMLLDELEPPAKKRRLWLWIASAAVVAAGLTVAAFLLLGSPATSAVADPCRPDLRVDSVWDGTAKASVKKALRATGRAHAQDSFERVDSALDSYLSDWKLSRKHVCETTSVQAMLQRRMDCLDHGLDQTRALVAVMNNLDPRTADGIVTAVHQLPSPAECAALRGEANPSAQTPAEQSYWAEMANLRASIAAGHYDDAVGQAKQLLMVAKAMGNVRYQADVGMWLAQSFMGSSGKAAEADQALDDALDAAARSKDDVLTAQLLILRIFIRGVQLNDFEAALALRPIASNAIMRAEADDKLRAQLAHAVGTVQLQKGDLKDAVASFESAVQLEIKTKGEESQSLPAMLNNLGGAYIRMGNVFEAKATLEKALKLQRKLLGPSHPDTALVMSTLGALAQAFSNWDESIRYFDEALRIFEEVKGPSHEQVGLLYYNLAVSRNGKEDFKAALPLYQKALAIFEALPQPNVNVALALIGIADCFEEIGRPKEGIADGERALALLSKDKPDNITAQVQLAMARFILAKALWAAGVDKVRAKELASQARDGFKAGGFLAITGQAAVEKWFEKIEGKTR